MKERSKNIFFVTGTDDAEIRRKAQELAMTLAPNDDAFGLEVIEPRGETVDHYVVALNATLESLHTFPFLGGGKLVWLKNALFLKDTPAGRSEATQEALEKLLKLLKSDLPEGTRFLLSAIEPDKRRSFYKHFLALATTTLCDKPDFGFNATENDVISWVKARARSRGVHLEEEAAEILAARVGANSGQIESELAKLITAAGTGATIHQEMVRTLVPQTRMGGIFDLSNAIAKRDLSLSLLTVRVLLRQGESAMGILLAAIVPTVRNLLLTKNLLVEHHLKAPEKPHFFSAVLQKLPSTATAHLPRKKDGSLNAYGLGISAVHANKFQESELIKGFLACRDTNQQLLRNQGKEELLLTQLIVKIAS